MNARDYWAKRYTEPQAIRHHATQNAQLSKDLMFAVAKNPVMNQALGKASAVLEIGCGTGDLSSHISRSYAPTTLYATDFSREAVMAATKRHPHLTFWVWDVLKDSFERTFDIAVSSNTLEHFTDPHLVIGRVLKYAKEFLIVVPYKQPLSDGFDNEGGAGHVSSFSKSSFSRYNVRAAAVFESKGWQHRVKKERPRQLAILIRTKR